MTAKEKAYELLDKAGVEYKKFVHPPLFTCEDASKVKYDCTFMEMKNLFLRNKDKTKYYLISMPAYKRADMKALQNALAETRFSFGSAEDMLEKLGVSPGSVSLLNSACIKDDNVSVVIDEEILTADLVGFHPNDNTETVVFDSKAIFEIFKHIVPQSLVVCLS